MLTKRCIAAVNYIIERVNYINKENYSERVCFTCKRLQRLLFLSYIEYAKRNNGELLFIDEFFAWPSGPVIPSVYHAYMKYQCGRLDPIDEKGRSCLTPAMHDSLEYVLRKTWDADEIDLSEMICVEGGPWSRFYNDNDQKHQQIIPKNEIVAYYMKHSILA